MSSTEPKALSKEEILGNNDIGSGSLYFNRAMEAMDDFSKQECIAFAEWIADPVNPFIALENNRWCQSCGNSTTWSTGQLYELFIQSQQSIK